MTQPPDFRHTPRKPLSQRSLLYGLSWLGGIGMLSGGMVFAQTPTPDSAAVPTAQDLLMPAAEPSAPVTLAPVVPTPAAPEPAVIESSPSRPVTAAPTPTPSLDTASEAPLTLPDNVANQVETLSPQPGNYIDTTDYSLGATPSVGQPNVILSERSTGCQMTLQHGQAVPNSVCATNPNLTVTTRPGVPNSPNMASVSSLGLGGNGSGVATHYYNVTERPSGLPSIGNVRLMFPLTVPVAITSSFGWRLHPITGLLRFHYGTDLGAPMGTPVLAAYTGRVAVADFMRGYGLTVVMRHSDPTAETLYAHLSEIFVQPGDWIEQGQVIGRVGSTGNSTGPHLHFEVRQRTSEGWVALNPGTMLQQALANFSKPFQLAQLSSASEQQIAFNLDGFQELLKVLQKDLEPLNFEQVQAGDGVIEVKINSDDVKNGSKVVE